MIRMLLAAAALLLAGPAAAQSKISDAEAAQINLSLTRGTLLYYFDQAAWHGTDDMIEKLPDYRDTVGGWIVDGTAEQAELVFYDRDEAEPRAVYAANFRRGELVSSHVLAPDEERTLGPERRALIAAKDKARDMLVQSGMARCAEQSFNTVVLPPETPGGPVLVYFLTPQTSNDSVPAGGHYLVEVHPGTRAPELRAFTKSCIELPTRDRGDGKKSEALIVTHLLDPVPTEIHVFTMLAARLPLFVITPGEKIWAVESAGGDARIRLVDQVKAKKRK